MDFSSKRCTKSERKFLLEFIDLYRQSTSLWSVRSAEYSDRDQKFEAYKRLLEKYRTVDPDASIFDVKKRINIMRSNFRREYRKVKKLNSGSKIVYRPNLWYFKELSFLSTVQKSLQPDNLNLTVSDENTSLIAREPELCTSLEQSKEMEASHMDLDATSESDHLVIDLDIAEETSNQQDSHEPILHANDSILNQLLTSKKVRSTPCASTKSKKQNLKKSPSKPKVSKNRTKKSYTEKEILTLAKALVQNPEDEYEAVAKAWAVKIRKMNQQQRVFAEKGINDIIFEGQLGALNRYSISINKPPTLMSQTPLSSTPASIIRFIQKAP